MWFDEGAVVAKWSGHQPGNRKVPGSMPRIDPRKDPRLLLCFLGQETYPSPSHPAVKPGNIVICVWQGTAEKQPLTDAVLPGKITFKKEKKKNEAADL